MSSDFKLKPGAADPITTTFTPTRAERLAQPCAHGLEVWRIDGERWHVTTLQNGHPVLMPCKPRPT